MKNKRIILGRSRIDVEYVKSCINRWRELGLEQNEIKNLIINIGDSEYTKTYIEDVAKREQYNFDSTSTYELIENAATTYKKSDKYRFRPIVNFEYVKKCINRGKELKLDSSTIKLIFFRLIRDSDYIKQFIENKKLWKELGFNSKDICELIIEVEDPLYIKQYVENPKLRENIELDGHDCAILISETYDIEYLKKYIKNQELQKELGFKDEDIHRLVLFSQEFDIIEERLKLIEERQKNNNDSNIDLPENMTIGIEIESEGDQSQGILNLTNLIGKGWKCKEDWSLCNGVEVVSPILSGKNENVSKQIKSVCNRIKGLRAKNF